MSAPGVHTRRRACPIAGAGSPSRCTSQRPARRDPRLDERAPSRTPPPGSSEPRRTTARGSTPATAADRRRPRCRSGRRRPAPRRDAAVAAVLPRVGQRDEEHRPRGARVVPLARRSAGHGSAEFLHADLGVPHAARGGLAAAPQTPCAIRASSPTPATLKNNCAVHLAGVDAPARSAAGHVERRRRVEAARRGRAPGRCRSRPAPAPAPPDRRPAPAPPRSSCRRRPTRRRGRRRRRRRRGPPRWHAPGAVVTMTRASKPACRSCRAASATSATPPGHARSARDGVDDDQRPLHRAAPRRTRGGRNQRSTPGPAGHRAVDVDAAHRALLEFDHALRREQPGGQLAKVRLVPHQRQARARCGEAAYSARRATTSVTRWPGASASATTSRGFGLAARRTGFRRCRGRGRTGW